MLSLVSYDDYIIRQLKQLSLLNKVLVSLITSLSFKYSMIPLKPGMRNPSKILRYIGVALCPYSSITVIKKTQEIGVHPLTTFHQSRAVYRLRPLIFKEIIIFY